MHLPLLPNPSGDGFDFYKKSKENEMSGSQNERFSVKGTEPLSLNSTICLSEILLLVLQLHLDSQSKKVCDGNDVGPVQPFDSC